MRGRRAVTLCQPPGQVRSSFNATPVPKNTHINVRSLNGCWICRLRRKKCDEASPSCSNCVRLSLHCEGYGPKPAWLDGGALEKAKAMEIKTMVKQVIKKRARGLSEPTQYVPSPIAQATTPLSSSSRPSRDVDFCQGVGPYTLDSDIENSPAWDLFSSNLWPAYNEEIISSLIPTTNIMPMCATPINESLVSYGGLASPNALTQRQSPVSPICNSLTSEAANVHRSLFQPYTDLQSLAAPAEWGLDNGLQNSPGSDPTSSAAGKRKRSTTRNVPESGNLMFKLNIAMDTHDGHEASLLMHYLDVVFYIQFPFYRSSATSRCRGWLLKLLTENRTVYYATIAFSHYHRDSKLFPSRSFVGKPRCLEKLKYHNLALSELQHLLGEVKTWDGSERLVQSIKVLACILQLVFLEVFSSSCGNWSFHLKAADSLLSTLVEARTSRTISISTTPREDEVQSEDFLATDTDLVVDFLLGSFAWLYVVGQASVRTKLSSLSKIEAVLEQDNFHLEGLFGCENWVICLILRISQLDEWKRECEKDRRLSIAELVRRGSQIETDLNHGLSEISARKTNFDKVSSSAVEDQHFALTECFGLAALTFVHVVVSGPYPELPEIEYSVSKGTDALIVLRKRKLLERAVWPLCVLGCMVSVSKQDFFRTQVTEEVFDGMTDGTIARAIEIVECCWRKRREGLGNCDWFSAMKSVGQHIILL